MLWKRAQRYYDLRKLLEVSYIKRDKIKGNTIFVDYDFILQYRDS